MLNYTIIREKNNGINGKTTVVLKLPKDYSQVINLICLHQNEDLEEI